MYLFCRKLLLWKPEKNEAAEKCLKLNISKYQDKWEINVINTFTYLRHTPMFTSGDLLDLISDDQIALMHSDYWNLLIGIVWIKELCDSVAACTIQNITQFIGRYIWNWCYTKEEVVEKASRCLCQHRCLTTCYIRWSKILCTNIWYKASTSVAMDCYVMLWM